jgi:mannose-1-phosphate guanylyltransferase
LALDSERSLLQATVERLDPVVRPEEVWISTTADLVAPIREQLPQIARDRFVVEPVGRNTAPAIGWAVRSMPERLRQGVVVVLPADHRVADPQAFRDTLARAIEVARETDRVLALGVIPRWAETGYGYLKLGAELDPGSGLRAVTRFTEKPDRARAKRFVKSGNYLWNAGIFVFRGETLLRELRRCEPRIDQGVERMAADPASVAEVYPTLPSISIDHAVMERIRGLATLPLDCGWSDLGSWAALAEVREKDAGGNACRGDVLAIEARDNLLFSEDGTIAVLGVEGLAVVRTHDVVLVAPLDRAQEVRRILAELESRGRSDRT